MTEKGLKTMIQRKMSNINLQKRPFQGNMDVNKTGWPNGCKEFTHLGNYFLI